MKAGRKKDLPKKKQHDYLVCRNEGFVVTYIYVYLPSLVSHISVAMI
jgi:hypothetical protein